MNKQTEIEKMTFLGIRVPEGLKEQFEQEAAKEDLKLTDIVRRAMREYLARKKKAVA